MMMFETSKHVPKTEKRCCVFENKYLIVVNKWFKRIFMLHIMPHELALKKPVDRNVYYLVLSWRQKMNICI